MICSVQLKVQTHAAIVVQTHAAILKYLFVQQKAAYTASLIVWSQVYWGPCLLLYEVTWNSVHGIEPD